MTIFYFSHCKKNVYDLLKIEIFVFGIRYFILIHLIFFVIFRYHILEAKS